MHALALGICDRALAPGGAAPEWVQLFPEGRMTGRDGREFDLADPAALVLAFQSAGVDLPIDYEHQNDRPEAKLNGPVPAAGWIKELKIAAGGLWGRVDWTATARELIGNREYRYLSPSFLFHPKTKAILRLKGAGLVHNPNLHLAALASQEDTMPPETTPAAARYARLAEALKLGPDATEEEMLAALAELLKAKGADAPDPARFVPVETVQAMLAERNLTLATASEGRATEKVADALRRGYISPAMKGRATALCMNDEASFDSFVASTVPAFAHLLKPSHMGALPPGSLATRTGSDMAEAVCAQLGLPPGTLKD